MSRMLYELDNRKYSNEIGDVNKILRYGAERTHITTHNSKTYCIFVYNVSLLVIVILVVVEWFSTGFQLKHVLYALLYQSMNNFFCLFVGYTKSVLLKIPNKVITWNKSILTKPKSSFFYVNIQRRFVDLIRCLK